MFYSRNFDVIEDDRLIKFSIFIAKYMQRFLIVSRHKSVNFKTPKIKNILLCKICLRRPLDNFYSSFKQQII